jgi:hypothetical protein
MELAMIAGASSEVLERMRTEWNDNRNVGRQHECFHCGAMRPHFAQLVAEKLALDAEVERLREALDAERKAHAEEERVIMASWESHRKDALRYRWLRQYPNHYFPEEQGIYEEELDAAIDKCIADGVDGRGSTT